jgi:AraC-like DNA-binding protein
MVRNKQLGVAEWHYDFAGFWIEPQGFQKLFHSQIQQRQQLLHSLWHWRQVAQELGKSENYLSRITDVAREVVRGVPLSDKARAAMHQDLQMTQPQHPQAIQGSRW